MNAKKSISSGFVIAVAVLGLALGACQSKKKVEDAAVSNNEVTSEQAPQIENTPMNFDAAGSDSGKIDGLHTIHFDYDKANLSAEAKKMIQQNAQWMKAHPGKVQIVAADRLPIISYGKEKPLDSGDSEAAYAKNRRANFLPLGN